MITLICNTSSSLPFDPCLLILPLHELVQRSAEEAQKYIQKQPNNPDVILALFYRACSKDKDADGAWVALYRQYTPLVLSWITPSRSSAPAHFVHEEETVGSLVNAAFEKFERSVSHKIHHFTRLPELLSYFERCTRSILVDQVRIYTTARYQRQSYALSWENLSDSPPEPLAAEEVADVVEQRCFAEMLWALVDDCLDDDERVLLHLTFQMDMKPGQISSSYPTLFQTPDDVYRIKRRVTERLANSRRLKGFLSEYNALPLPIQRTERKAAS